MLGHVLRTLVDLLAPCRCGGCSAPGELLCPACRPHAPIRVAGCAVSVTAAGPYADGLRKAVLRYKERGRHDLAAPLAALLAEAASGLVSPGTVLVPVPSSRAAARRRGGDHMHRLARRAGQRLGIPAVPALRLVRAVRDSAGLGASERHTNLTGAMAARPGPPGAAAVIVDDIVTTGATLAESVRALRCAGWPIDGAAVVAITPRRAAAVGDR
jgi:predicted amidophosphoribosyltransferase